jgi:hypothetical protein
LLVQVLLLVQAPVLVLVVQVNTRLERQGQLRKVPQHKSTVF